MNHGPSAAATQWALQARYAAKRLDGGSDEALKILTPEVFSAAPWATTSRSQSLKADAARTFLLYHS
jgi:hypothetical protein